MKKTFLALSAILVLGASCSLFGPSNVITGVVKTVNGGTDWEFSNSIKDSKLTMAGLHVSRMMFDPQNREIVYASGYNDGIYKSEDSGRTWKRILSNILVYDFQIHPQDSKTMYAAGLFNGHGRVLLTKDGGGSWNQIFNDASDNNAVRSIVLNPSNPSQVLIGLTNGNAIKSSDAGYSWKFVKYFADRINRMAWQNNTIYVLLRNNGLYQTPNFGDSFTELTKPILDIQTAAYSDTSLTFNQFYVDSLSPALMYVTTSKGLYKSIDQGITWAAIRLPIQQQDSLTYGIAVAKNSSNIVFTSIGSTLYKSTDGGYNWQTQKVATNALINYILIDPQLPQIAYAGLFAQ